MGPLLFLNNLNFLIPLQTVLKYEKSAYVEEVKILLLHQLYLLSRLPPIEDSLYLVNFRKAVVPFSVNQVELTLILKTKAASVT